MSADCWRREGLPATSRHHARQLRIVGSLRRFSALLIALAFEKWAALATFPILRHGPGGADRRAYGRRARLMPGLHASGAARP